MPGYAFKTIPELAWFVLTMVAGALAAGVATQGAVAPTDWQAWVIGVASASIRALLGGGLAVANKVT